MTKPLLMACSNPFGSFLKTSPAISNNNSVLASHQGFSMLHYFIEYHLLAASSFPADLLSPIRKVIRFDVSTFQLPKT